MTHIIFHLKNGETHVSNSAVKQSISYFFERYAIDLIQGNQLTAMEINGEFVHSNVIEKLMNKFYKQYGIVQKKHSEQERQDDFLKRCLAVKSQITDWTTDLQREEWPIDRQTGEKVDPEEIKAVFGEALRLGLDVHSLLIEFVQALQEHH